MLLFNYYLYLYIIKFEFVYLNFFYKFYNFIIIFKNITYISV